jgi:Immunoglobulin I-set domain.
LFLLPNIEYPPDFGARSIPPATSTQALVGGTAEINCVPNGAPIPTIRWKKLNSTLDVVMSDERFAINPTTGTLKILNIKKTDVGLYQCIATNKLGTAERVGELKVNGK